MDNKDFFQTSPENEDIINKLANVWQMESQSLYAANIVKRKINESDFFVEKDKIKTQIFDIWKVPYLRFATVASAVIIFVTTMFFILDNGNIAEKDKQGTAFFDSAINPKVDWKTDIKNEDIKNSSRYIKNDNVVVYNF